MAAGRSAPFSSISKSHTPHDKRGQCPYLRGMGDSPDTSDGLPWETGAGDASEDTPDSGGPSAAELEEAGQGSMFGGAPEPTDAPSEPRADPAVPPPAQPVAPDPAQPYRVLARKYRPQTFSELIGQEPMVRTLANAIARDRLAHAFLMTGVRGVGKTSTAAHLAMSAALDGYKVLVIDLDSQGSMTSIMGSLIFNLSIMSFAIIGKSGTL